MSARRLVTSPSLENLKKQSRQLLNACKSGDADACGRIRRVLPPYLEADDGFLRSTVKLADAQAVIALEYGFPSWAKLKHHLLSASGPVSASRADAERVDADDVASLLSDLETSDGLRAEIVLALRTKARLHDLIIRELPNRLGAARSELNDLLSDGVADRLAIPQADQLAKVDSALERLNSETQTVVSLERSAKRRLTTAADAVESSDTDALRESLKNPDIRADVTDVYRSGTVLRSFVSHEIRTAFNAVIGFTRIVLKNGGDKLSERERLRLRSVLKQSESLLDLINNLLDMTKVEAGLMDVAAESFDVGALVDECIAKVAAEIPEGVNVGRNMTEEAGRAHTDRARLRQLLVGLLLNALKFTQAGPITIGARKEGRILHLNITDSGPGIPDEAIEHIFDDCWQVREGSEGPWGRGLGAGLMLSNARRFAELLGGSIHAESEPGEGSTFTVTVPVDCHVNL